VLGQRTCPWLVLSTSCLGVPGRSGPAAEVGGAKRECKRVHKHGSHKGGCKPRPHESIHACVCLRDQRSDGEDPAVNASPLAETEKVSRTVARRYRRRGVGCWQGEPSLGGAAAARAAEEPFALRSRRW